MVDQIVGKCKTETSRKPVVMDQHLAQALIAWRQESMYTEPQDWVWASLQRKGLFYFLTERKIRSGQPLCKCSKRTYTSWRKMIERCTYNNHPQFDDYGGRGITVCQRWRESFCAFLEDMGKRP